MLLNYCQVFLRSLLQDKLGIQKQSYGKFKCQQKYFSQQILTMNQLSSLIKKHKLNQLLKSKTPNIFTSLSIFFNQYFQTLPKIFNQRLQYIKETLTFIIQKLQKQTTSKTQKLWIRLILIEIILNTCDPSLITQQIVLLFCSQCKIKPTQLKITGKLSQSFFAFRSLLGNNKICLLVQNNQNKSLHDQIVSQICLLLRKKLTNWKFFCSIGQNQKQQKLNINKDEQYIKHQQKVWKVINHFKAYDIIVKNYKSIETIDIKMKPFMIAAFNLIAKDIIKTYPFIVKLIEYQAELVKEKYEQIKNLDSQLKNEKRKLMEEIYCSDLFVELKNLIRELESINLIVMYVFYGVHHKNEIVIGLPKEFILNTGHAKLDLVYKIQIQVNKIQNKREKQRKNLLKLSSRLSKSQNMEKNRVHQQIIKNLSQILVSKAGEINPLQQIRQNQQQIQTNKCQKLQIDETEQSQSFIDQDNSDPNTQRQAVNNYY